MYTKYNIILLIFITVQLCPLNVYGMDGASYYNYDPGYGMDDASSSNYGNKSKSEQKYVLFKGFVQIGETKRAATKNEVVMVIFCREKAFTGGIFTDEYGKLEVAMHASDVEALEKCKQNELNIGFYRKDLSESLKLLRNPLDSKDKICDEFTENELEKLEEEREQEKKDNINEFLNKQIFKQDDENSFQISFDPNYAAINETEAELDDSERYHTYSANNYFFNSTEDSAKSETSSGEKLVKKVYEKAKRFFGKKEKN